MNPWSASLRFSLAALAVLLLGALAPTAALAAAVDADYDYDRAPVAYDNDANLAAAAVADGSGSRAVGRPVANESGPFGALSGELSAPRAPSTAGTPRAGLGVNDTPARLPGPWSDTDLTHGLYGRAPRSMGSPHLHHADQMPGSGIHEVLPDAHMAPGVHPNRFNQGVTDAMRTADRELHWWYRAQEMGAWDRLGPGMIYDNWPGGGL